MHLKQAVGVSALALSAVVAVGSAALVGPTALAKAQQTVARQNTGAKQSGPYAARVHELFGRVERELNLTRAQKAEIKAILQNAVPQGRALYNDQSLTPAQQRAKLQALRVATRAEIQKALTPHQQGEIAAMKAGAPQQGRALLHKLAQDLQLTPAQQSQLKPVLEKTAIDLKSLHNDTSLTVAQKIDRLRQIHNSTQTQVKAVLTPAQEKRLEAIKAEISGAVRSEIRQRIQAYWNQH